ncbi:MAG: serine/threonine protein kinase [Deltaproteobacteria bacterium]|nr:MAG: serine/threonine protein kinase [Deltaproteobacteria bacterium]
MHFGRYELLEPLGRGGFAEVYRARLAGPEGFAKEVVVKRLRREVLGEESVIQMFLTEARLTAAIAHPHLVQVFDFGEVEGEYFLAMESIDGWTARAWWRKAGAEGVALPLEVVLCIGLAVSDALAALHEARDESGRPLGIVHRDISPQNIMISRHGQVKLLDLGVAKSRVQTEATRAGILKGKYAYMSPEQIAQEPLDGRSDLFSLGVVLHELATGRRLFKRKTDYETLAAIHQVEAPPPSILRPDLPPWFDALVDSLLQKDRGARLPSARHLHERIEAHLPEVLQGTPAAALRAFGKTLFGAKALAEDSVPPVASDAPDTVATGRLPRGASAPSAAASGAGDQPPSPEAGQTEYETDVDAGPQRVHQPRRGTRSAERLLLFALVGALAVAGGLLLSLHPFGAPRVPEDARIVEPFPSADPRAPATQRSTAESEPDRGPGATPRARPRAHPTESARTRPAAAATTARATKLRSRGGQALRQRPRAKRTVPATGPNRAGTLFVECPRPCRVRVDGRDLGRHRDAKAFELAMGSHQLEIEEEGGGRRLARTVLVAPDRVRRIRFGAGSNEATGGTPSFNTHTGTEGW